MKTKLFLLGILLCLARPAARAADVGFNYQSSDTTPQGLKNVTLYPLGAPFTNGNGAIITRDWLSGTTDTNGQLVISNLYGGSYEGILEGSTRKTTNWYDFPMTNGFIYADRYGGPQTNGPGGIIAYSQAQANSKFLLKTGDTNVSLTGKVTFGTAITNETVAVTNDFRVVFIDNTNFLFASGIGDAASQGQYGYKDTVGGISRYTNSLGNGKTIGYDPDELDFGLDYRWALTNGAGVVQYGTPFQTLPSSFVHISGPAPDGTLRWGTNFTTNIQAVVTVSPLPLPDPVTQSNVLFVRTNGLDLFALRGREDWPYRSVWTAVTNAAAGDIISIGYGVFDETAAWDTGYQLPAGVQIRGQGQGFTKLIGVQNFSQFHLGNSNIVARLSSTNIWYYDGNLAVITNVLFDDIEATASGDVIVFSTGAWMPTIRNCRLSGNSDKIAEFDANPAYFSNNVITVINTFIGGGPGTDGFGLRFAQGGGRSQWKIFSEPTDTSPGIVATHSTAFSARVGYYLETNAISTWPAAPLRRGEAFWGNSNGWVYLLQSNPTGTAWTKTNLVGSP